jgi:diguanylate cyclase (GGDEF)-like protein
VTARLEAERELGHRAGHDALTGLPNRALLADRWIRARARRAADPQRGTFLLLCDVDGLKEVNDHDGHRAGDELIVEVARRLAAEVRPSDTVARLGGDEFVVLVEGVPTEHIEALALRLRRSVSAAGRARRARLSVGWAADDPARAPETVLAEADARMYEDKRAARTVDVRSHDLRARRLPTRP